MNKRERAATWAKSLMKRTHTSRNWTHSETQTHLEAAWLAGARSMNAWHRQRYLRPAPVRVSDVDVTVGPLSSAGKTLDLNTCLVIPALGTRPVRPRPKVGQDVRLLVVRECFQVHLKVGDVGEVIKDDGGLLTVQWRTGHMWIDAADVEVVGDGVWA